jgi:hypothetical protein
MPPAASDIHKITSCENSKFPQSIWDTRVGLKWGKKIYCIRDDSVLTFPGPHPELERDQPKNARSESVSSPTMEMMIGAVVLLGVVVATGIMQLRAVLRRAVRAASDSN